MREKPIILILTNPIQEICATLPIGLKGNTWTPIFDQEVTTSLNNLGAIIASFEQEGYQVFRDYDSKPSNILVPAVCIPANRTEIDADNAISAFQDLIGPP